MQLVEEFSAIVRSRELLWQMTVREIKSRYKQSILGYFWVILNPLAQMLVMSFAFSLVLRIPTRAHQNIPYSLFLFTALLPWNLFQNSLSSATNSLVVNSNLLTKIYFPRTILVLSAIIAKIIDFLFATIILVGFLIVFRLPVSIHIIWIIPIFFIQQLLTLGLSLFLAAANLLYRDIQYLLGLILTLWLYLTPVIYPVDLVPDKYRFLYQLNPMAVIINAYRQTILGQNPPNYTSIATALIVSSLFLIGGLAYFKSQEKIFADNI